MFILWNKILYKSDLGFRYLFPEHEIIFDQDPVLREWETKNPVTDFGQIVILDRIKFCLRASCILKPHLMLPPSLICVSDM